MVRCRDRAEQRVVGANAFLSLRDRDARDRYPQPKFQILLTLRWSSSLISAHGVAVRPTSWVRVNPVDNVPNWRSRGRGSVVGLCLLLTGDVRELAVGQGRVGKHGVMRSYVERRVSPIFSRAWS